MAFLTCPNCGADAIEHTDLGCPVCFNESHDTDVCTVELRPMWEEDLPSAPQRLCPVCNVPLRIVVDDDHAYAEVDA